jgi:hypothetical protein
MAQTGDKTGQQEGCKLLSRKDEPIRVYLMSPTSYLTAPPRDTGGIIGSAIVWVKQELVEVW